MSESAEGSPISMSNPERPIEERQVANAVKKARTQFNIGPGGSPVELRPVAGGSGEEGIITIDRGPDKPLMQIRRIAGGALEPIGEPLRDDRDISGEGLEGGLELLSPEERERMRREQSREYTRGRWLEEIARASEEPTAVLRVVRMIMANAEARMRFPQPHQLDTIRGFLRDKAAVYSEALRPGRAQELGLDRFGLIIPAQKEESRLRPTKMRGVGEIDLTKNELDQLRTLAGKSLSDDDFEEIGDDKYRATIRDELIRQLSKSRKGLRFANEVILATEIKPVNPEEMREKRERYRAIAEQCERSEREMYVRERFLIASILYDQQSGLADKLCQLFEDGRYAYLEAWEWKTLFSMEATYVGERAFGEKMDMAMRLYALLGTGGGAGGADGARSRIENEISINHALRNWLNRNTYYGRDREGFLDDISRRASRNIFCAGPPYEDAGPRTKSWAAEVRDWVRETIGGDKGDTEAAEELGWRVFYMWGLAAHFDGRANLGDRGYLTVEEYMRDPGVAARRELKLEDDIAGWPATDDRYKLFGTEKWRRREAGGHHNCGPHATLNEYDRAAYESGALGGEFSMAVSFMHWALPQKEGDRNIKVGEMRSFWERWWREGTSIKDLPWDSMREFMWWNYNLALYFAGGYRGGSLLDIIKEMNWERSKLITIDKLQDIARTVEYAIGNWCVTKGETRAWIDSLSPELRREIEERARRDYRSKGKTPPSRLEDFTNSDITKFVTEPMRLRVRENILFGVLTNAYMGRDYLTAANEWALWSRDLGIPWEQGAQIKNITRRELDLWRIIARSRFLDSQAIERVSRRSGEYLKANEVISSEKDRESVGSAIKDKKKRYLFGR